MKLDVIDELKRDKETRSSNNTIANVRSRKKFVKGHQHSSKAKIREKKDSNNSNSNL